MMKLYVNILRLALWQKVNLMLIKIYIIVATAHLAKFEDVIEPILDIQVPTYISFTEATRQRSTQSSN